MSAQISPILADLQRHRHCFDLDRGLAEPLAEATAAAIFEYMEAQVDPDGHAWEPLSEKYAEWKATHAPGAKMSELYYRMKAPDQLKGELGIDVYRLEQTYGLDLEARQEAEWFQEGNPNQPPRPFYAFNDLAAVYLANVLDRAFDDATK